MAVPFDLAIPGRFTVIGKEPDGDSVRFIPDDPALLHKLHRAFRVRESRTDSSVQLRFEAIDTPELHYGAAAQPLGAAARDLTLELLGFAGLEYAGGKVTAATPPQVRGMVLSKAADANGRPIAYVLTEDAAQDIRGGAWTQVDEALLARTINAEILRRGLAYLTVYTSTPPEHRDFMRGLALEARSQQRGVWAQDASADFVLETQADLGPEGALVLPKLFRRATDYLKSVSGGYGGNLSDWMRDRSSGSRPENDRVFLEQSGVEVAFADLLRQQNRRVSLEGDLLYLTFLEK